MSESNIHAAGLAVPPVHLYPADQYDTQTRLWQGIPGIERTSAGRLFATWYSGGEGEGPQNHTLIVQSDDDGLSWSEPIVVVDPLGEVRSYDPVLWIDPQQRLWFFWAQNQGWWNGRGGVWFIRCDAPDADKLEWTSPVRIGNGVMMNKPLVQANGDWLLPIAIWGTRDPKLPELKDEAVSSVFRSQDQGATFERIGGADVPLRDHDEHMVIERRDGSLWMLVRTTYGIGDSVSTDGGFTWSPGKPTAIAGPNTRFFITRLASGRLFLVNHLGFTGRSHMTASLSEDDGLTWTSHLLLDERSGIAYPDATIDTDGRIRIVYDRERHGAREILLANITEADVLAGEIVDPGSSLRRIINKVIR